MAFAQLDDIFARSLLGDYDDDAPWEAVWALHRVGSREVLTYAAEWCSSQNRLKRARGADVLAQLCHPRVPTHREPTRGSRCDCTSATSELRRPICGSVRAGELCRWPNRNRGFARTHGRRG